MIDLLQAIRERHSVRRYTDKPVPAEVANELQQMANQYNEQAGLHIQVVTDDPTAFSGFMARYGKFSGVNNYIALVGTKADHLDEQLGYYGEHLVLRLQQLGLNSCWVGLTYSKNPDRVTVEKGEKFVAVICFGYGATQGVAHKSKKREQVMTAQDAPDWFLRGVDAALLAPTATNQQKFRFILHDDGSVEEKTGWGFFAHVDLGIVKYHFELGAGQPVKWC
ncbi:MAG: nitroreductase family protein [Prevotella sp.]|jgi:nitroreductase